MPQICNAFEILRFLTHICKISLQKNDLTEDVIASMEKKTEQLQKDLMEKERETLKVLKELETTKIFLDDLKLKIDKEDSEVVLFPEKKSDSTQEVHKKTDAEDQCPKKIKPSLHLILMDLKQAKLNLNSLNLSGIRSSVRVLKDEIDKEKMAMEKTRENIASKCSYISSLGEELSQTDIILQTVKDSGLNDGSGNHTLQFSRKLHTLRPEAEQFRGTEAVSESEILKMKKEMEQTKYEINTLEVKALAARKVEEAAKEKASKHLATLSEIKAPTDIKISNNKVTQKPFKVTLPLEDYNVLVHRAQDAERRSRKKIKFAIRQMDEAKKCKMDLLNRSEEADAEIKISRRALSEALQRVDAANKGKLAVETALRKWRSEHGQKRRSSVCNLPTFKNPHSNNHRRNSKSAEINGSSIIAGTDTELIMPPLSIGNILSEKLILQSKEVLEMAKKDSIKSRPKDLSSKISLGELLKIKHDISSHPQFKSLQTKTDKKTKKKKFGFVGSLSFFPLNQNEETRKIQAWSPK